MNIYLLLILIIFNQTYSFYTKNFLRISKIKLNSYKYEKEYYDFYNNYKQKLLTNSLNVNHTSFIDKNINNYKIFEKNVDYINEMNQNLLLNNENLKLGINQFTDSISFEDNNNNDLMKFTINKNEIPIDYKNLFLKPFRDPFHYIKNIFKNNKTFNWNTTNLLSPVKNQLSCGSCWAFSTTSSLETYMRINNYTIDRLSEQELVDCSKENNGCQGGLMHLAFDYIINNKGLHKYKDYKYNAIDNNCSKPQNISKALGSNITEYSFIIPKSIFDIKLSVEKSPVTIALDANNFYFRFYKEGVIDLPGNYSKELNHAVLLVGYNYDEKGMYWIIQNSWGESWGENGFCKIRVNKDEGTLLCQLYGVYPTK